MGSKDFVISDGSTKATEGTEPSHHRFDSEINFSPIPELDYESTANWADASLSSREHACSSKPSLTHSAPPSFQMKTGNWGHASLSSQGAPPHYSLDKHFYVNTPSDLSSATDWLTEAGDDAILRITGGSLMADQYLAQQVKRELLDALRAFSGICLSGSTQTTFHNSPSRSPFGMHEIGALLEGLSPAARVLGVVPRKALTEDEDGRQVVSYDEYKGEITVIRPHESQSRFLLAGETEGYFWDPEWQACLALTRKMLHSGNARLAVNVSFDGGQGTANEINAWIRAMEEDARMHFVLIRGSSPERATDTFAAQEKWIRRHKNVHVVNLSAPEISEKLLHLGLLTRSHEHQLLEVA